MPDINNGPNEPTYERKNQSKDETKRTEAKKDKKKDRKEKKQDETGWRQTDGKTE